MTPQKHIEERLSRARLNVAVALDDHQRSQWLDCVESWEEVIALRREYGLWDERIGA